MSSALYDLRDDLESVTPEAMRTAFEVNTIAPLMIAKVCELHFFKIMLMFLLIGLEFIKLFISIEFKLFLIFINLQAFLPLLRKAAKSDSLNCSTSCIANVSSKVGSVADNSSGNIYGYRSSKVYTYAIASHVHQY